MRGPYDPRQEGESKFSGVTRPRPTKLRVRPPVPWSGAQSAKDNPHQQCPCFCFGVEYTPGLDYILNILVLPVVTTSYLPELYIRTRRSAVLRMSETTSALLDFVLGGITERMLCCGQDVTRQMG